MARLEVIMTAYNAEKYIKEAIDSILDQVFQDFNFLIIDDGSTDATRSIIESYKDSRIRLICPGKVGYYRAKQMLIEMSTAEYIAVMDADDISDKDRFSRQIAFLDANPDYGLIGCRARWIDQYGVELGQHIDFYESNDEIKAILLFINPLVHTSVMIRRSVLQEHQLNYKAIAGEDFDLWIRINRYAKSCNLPEFLLKYRVHPNNMCYSDWYKLNDGIRELLYAQLDMYFPGECNVDDKDAHVSLVDFSLLRSPADMPEVTAWILKLQQLNQRHNSFDPHILSQVLYERVLKKFLRLDGYDMSVYRTLLGLKRTLKPQLSWELRKKELAILAFSLAGKKFIATD